LELMIRAHLIITSPFILHPYFTTYLKFWKSTIICLTLIIHWRYSWWNKGALWYDLDALKDIIGRAWDLSNDGKDGDSENDEDDEWFGVDY